jgi:hypothetical protein
MEMIPVRFVRRNAMKVQAAAMAGLFLAACGQLANGLGWIDVGRTGGGLITLAMLVFGAVGWSFHRHIDRRPPA